MMLRLVAISAGTLSLAGAAKTCLQPTESLDLGPDCTVNGKDPDSGDVLPLAEVCFATYKEVDGAKTAVDMTGCVPAKYTAALNMDVDGCNANVCWCTEDDCNTDAWAAEARASFFETYVPPIKCYEGIAGANPGPRCVENEIFKTNEYKLDPSNSCHGRALHTQCVENNMHMGMGDGCNAEERANKASCEAYAPREPRNADESYDKTTNHCRMPTSSPHRPRTPLVLSNQKASTTRLHAREV